GLPQALPPEPLLEPARQLVGVELAQVAAVHPAELLLVEDGRVARDAVEREALDQLLGREEGGGLVVAPAEQREIVADRLRQVARLAQLLHRGGPVALRELLAVGTEQQREVRVDRRGRAQRLQDPPPTRRVRE